MFFNSYKGYIFFHDQIESNLTVLAKHLMCFPPNDVGIFFFFSNVNIYTLTFAQNKLIASGGKPRLRKAVNVNNLGSSQSLSK